MQNHKKNKSITSASTNRRSIRMRQIENTNSFSTSTTSIPVEEYRTYSISGETTNGIFYLEPGLDIGYLKNTNGGWDVFLYKPIKIYHDVSTGILGGQLVLTIEKNWTINLTFTMNQNNENMRNIYGRITMETDVINDNYMVKDVVVMQNNSKITRHEQGAQRGRYYNIVGGIATIQQTNQTKEVNGKSVLNVRNLYDIIRVDAEISSLLFFYKFFDTVGIRVRSRIPYDSNKLSAPFNPPSTIQINDSSKRNDNLIVDISDYVTFETTINGMIDVKIATPLTIYRDLSISGAWGGQMITTIDKKWNIVTTYNCEAWPNKSISSNVQGDLIIEANINEENNINTGDGNVVNVYSRRNMFSRFESGTSYDFDNFSYLQQTKYSFTVSHNLKHNKETLSFRNLDNLVRIYTDIVRYELNDDDVYTLDDRSHIKNTLTLMCKYKPPTTDNSDENKKAYFSVSKPPTLIKNSIQIDNLNLVFTIPNSAAGYYDIDLDPQLNAYSPFYFYRYEPNIGITYNRFTIDDVTNVYIKNPDQINPVNVVDATDIKNEHVNVDSKNILRLKMLENKSVFQIKSCELTARCEPKIYNGYKTLSRIKLTWKILNMGMTIIIEPIENIIFITRRDLNGNDTILQQYTY